MGARRPRPGRGAGVKANEPAMADPATDQRVAAEPANDALELAVHTAIGAVDDPEYPGISIIDLGLLERVDIVGGAVSIGLVPTFSGCPALAMIADDVRRVVAEVPGVDRVRVEWLAAPPWTVDRVSADARAAMAREFTVAVRIGSAEPRCPRCGGATIEQSMFGPSRCRSVHRCQSCGENVEVLRS